MQGLGTLPGRHEKALAALLIAAVAIPFLLVRQPALIDLPGHLQRYHIQAAIDHSEALAAFYDYRWRFVPNLGADLLMIPLAKLVGIEAGARLILILITTSGAAGMLWIAREAHGRVPLTSLFALPLIFSYPLTFGFVNSCLSVSLALLAFGWWLRLTREGSIRLRAITFALIAPLLLLCHIVGYGVLGLLAGGALIGRSRAADEPFPRSLGRAILACLPMAWPLVLMLVWQTGGGATTSGWLNWSGKTLWIVTILREHVQWFDLASAGIVYAVAALPWLARRRFAYTPPLALPALLLWVAALILPTRILGSEMASVRLIPVACAITILAVGPIGRMPRWLAGLAIAFLAARLLETSTALIAADARHTEQLAALDYVRPGARVIAILGIDCPRRWDPPRDLNLMSYATVRRDAFVNNQFDTTEGQLLSIRLADYPALRDFPRSQMRQGPCPRWSQLPDLTKASAGVPWHDIDYLWLINVEAPLRPAKRGLSIVWQRGNSLLYRVDNP